MTLRPSLFRYQREDVEGLLNTPIHGKLLASEPGVGKSAIAVEFCNRMAPKSILVLCPASLKINWQREFAMWDFWGVEPQIVTSKQIPSGDYLICNYDILTKVGDKLPVPEILICDESHYLKQRSAGRSKAANRLCKAVRERGGSVVFLTGTPIENSPIELWHQLVCLGWLKPDSYMDYAVKFCNYRRRRIYIKGRPRDIVDVSGATNIPELRQLLLDRGMVRRKKADVLSELPPKTYQIIELPRRKQWRSSLLQSATGDVQTTGQVAYFKNLAAVAARTGDKKRLVESIAEARKLDGIEKMQQACDFIVDLLESEKKVVVFCYHRDVWAGIYAGLHKYRPVGICGETPSSARQKSVDDFQTKDDVRVFVGQIKAAGTGITLTAASHVVFVELDWVPGLMEQAADRCHRQGQKDNVLVQYLVFEDSTDGMVAAALIRKQQTLSAMFDADTTAYGDAGIDPLEIFGAYPPPDVGLTSKQIF